MLGRLKRALGDVINGVFPGNGGANSMWAERESGYRTDEIETILRRGVERKLIPEDKKPDVFLPQFKSCLGSGHAIPPDLQDPKRGLSLAGGSLFSGVGAVGYCYQCKTTGGLCQAKKCPAIHPESYEDVGDEYLKPSMMRDTVESP